MRKAGLFIAGVLSLVTCHANASQPDYFGRWIDDQGKCDSNEPRDRLSYGSYEFTQEHRYHSEGVCNIKNASKRAGKWEFDEECRSGAEQNYAVTHMHWSLTVDGDKMTATVTHPGEKPTTPFTMSRCGPETTRGSWQKFDENSYIDSSTKQSISFGNIKLSVLHDYEEITSAMMFGLSEKEDAEFDCNNSQYTSLGDVWYEGRMGQGKVAKRFSASNKWSPIPPYYIKLFAAVCAP